MPAEHDLDPLAMTEEERLAKRRYEAGFAFETQPRTEHFNLGTSEGRSAADAKVTIPQPSFAKVTGDENPAVKVIPN